VIGVRGSKEEAGHLNVGEHQIQPVKAFQRLNSLHAIRGLDDLETLLRKGFRHESPNQKSSSTRGGAFLAW
jgi:hypothetical protein